jgi:hypothetical protein
MGGHVRHRAAVAGGKGLLALQLAAYYAADEPAHACYQNFLHGDCLSLRARGSGLVPAIYLPR